jgi:uncharacterized protein (TIGR02246 family)
VSASTTTSPQATIDGLFDALDALDIEAIEAICLPDAQAVDELSGEWCRGREAMCEYLATLKASGIVDLRSTIADAQVIEWGDTALATMILGQSYTTGRERVVTQAPTTIVLRRPDRVWRLALVHSVPVAVAG